MTTSNSDSFIFWKLRCWWQCLSCNISLLLKTCMSFS
uniref:Uncharacterized protein n=1 Tax=Wuchereria bancrofti TaxID=6293 RepID=A0AAF5PJK0_WUCBA